MDNSANYISYTSRERHLIVDQAVQAGLDTLRMPHVVQRLGDYATSLTALLSDVSVPNVRHGVLDLHADCFTKTPIVAVDTDEVLHWNDHQLAMHERQQRSLYNAYGDETAELLIDSVRPGNGVACGDDLLLPSMTQRESMAHVVHRAAILDTNLGEYMAWSSPIVMIDARRKDSRAPTVLLHELTHVEQLYCRPILTPDEEIADWALENELEAYHVEAQAMYGYHAVGQWSILLDQTGPGNRALVALEIDAIRRKNVSDPRDPFWPNQAIRRVLRNRQIPIQ